MKEIEDIEVFLIKYTKMLWGGRKLILISCVIGVFVAIVYLCGRPDVYKASVVLAPESKSGSTSNFGAMASMLGAGNVSFSDRDALGFSMAPSIVASTPFLLELFDMEVTSIDGEKYTLGSYVTYPKYAWWKYVIKPSLLKSLFSKSKPSLEHQEIDPFRLTGAQKWQISMLQASISCKPNASDGTSEISVTLQDPLIAATVADEVARQLQAYVSDYRTTKAKQTYEYLEQLYQQAQADYYEAQQEYANYVDKHQSLILRSVMVEQERLQNEANVKLQVYTSLATQLQSAKAKVHEDLAVFVTLEPASVPLSPSGPSSRMVIFLFIVLGILFSCSWILFGRGLCDIVKKSIKS